MGKPKTKAKQYVDKNPIEQLLGGGLDSILGIGTFEGKHNRREGVMEEGQEINLKSLQDKKAEEKEEKPKSLLEYISS